MDLLIYELARGYVYTFALVAIYLLGILLRRRDVTKLEPPVKVLAVLGSGGHTRELLSIVGSLSTKKFSPVVYVHSESDALSVKKAEFMEKSRDNTFYSFHAIPRSRAVGQSYFTSVFTTLYSFWFSISLVWRLKPGLIVCTGPGVCVPIVYVAVIFKWLLNRKTGIIFIESICRVKTLSLTGKLVRPVVDEFIVQWEEMRNQFKGTTYIGRIC